MKVPVGLLCGGMHEWLVVANLFWATEELILEAVGNSLVNSKAGTLY